MKKRTTIAGNPANYLYAVILFFAGTIAFTALWLNLTHRDLGRILDWSHMISFYAHVSLALMVLGFAVLVWRIWMNCRYRPCPAESDPNLLPVTIVIPAYNEGRQVLDTVRSVMASDYPADKMQVICVDDGSADDTWQWMLQAQLEFPSRLRLIRQPRNRGKREALMQGFRNAEGQVLVTIDSDSEVLPGTLRNLVSPMAADPRVGAVAGNVRVLNCHEGFLPKMMEVAFTSAFDFIRSGQSVYGGVYCTPGALSAYRLSVVNRHLASWVHQTFMGSPATIGEDRSLTNFVLRSGFRVVYQRDAVVYTKVPDNYRGLRRMMMRWARSDVRESLVMATFMLRRFRPADSGGGWVRVFGVLQLVRLAVTEALKIGLLAHLLINPVPTVMMLTLGCFTGAAVPAIVYQWRYGGSFGWRWAVPYSFYRLFALSWISFWGLFSATRSGWLTRGAPSLSTTEQRPISA